MELGLSGFAWALGLLPPWTPWCWCHGQFRSFRFSRTFDLRFLFLTYVWVRVLSLNFVFWNIVLVFLFYRSVYMSNRSVLNPWLPKDTFEFRKRTSNFSRNPRLSQKARKPTSRGLRVHKKSIGLHPKSHVFSQFGILPKPIHVNRIIRYVGLRFYSIPIFDQYLTNLCNEKFDALQYPCDSSSRQIYAFDSSARDRIVRSLWDPGLKGFRPWYITYSDYKEIQSSHLEKNPHTLHKHKHQARSRM